MKKGLALTLAAVMTSSMITAPNALALNYSGSQGNEATFETLQEARISGPEAVKDLETNQGKMYVSHPVLDGYTEGTTYVYRSPNLFGGRAAARLNTNILVFSDKHFEDKTAAQEYLKELGVTDLIDQATGSAILVTPADPEAGFGAADQKNYYALQTAICSQKAGGKDAEGNDVSYSDAEYFGGYGYIYAIGIDGGATFLNNYIAGSFDYVSRIAGMLLINGDMDSISRVASLVPTYLVNAPESVVEKYKAANDVNASDVTAKTAVYFNQELPLQKVAVALQEKTEAEHIADAYYDMFIKAMRVPVVQRGLYTAGTPWQGYNFDQAPYSLCDRNAVIAGVTEDGIHVIRHDEERFAEIQTEGGEYLQTWFEYLPEEVLNHTAPAGSVPLILANHGGGDDPRLFVDEIGLLELAGKERFAMVAPEHQYIGFTRTEDGMKEGILPQVLPELVKYMLETYPELDASRVYATGYSMGGGATFRGISGDASLFAAAVPMAASGYVPTEEEAAQYDTLDLPIMLTTSSFDLAGAFNQTEGIIAEGYQTQLNLYLGFNEMNPITFDFDTYDLVGFEADRTVKTTLNKEYENTTWYLNNDAGVPMVAVSYTDSLVHALYPEYGKLVWNFAKHYSRNQETGAIEYNPFVD